MTTANDDHSKDQLQSPRAMAEAAVAEAMAERGRVDSLKRANDEDAGATGNQGGGIAPSTQDLLEHRGEPNNSNVMHANTNQQDSSETPSAENKDEANNMLHDAWKPIEEQEWTNDKALETTLNLVQAQVDDLVRCGLQAFHGLESTTRQLEQSQQVAESTTHELERVKSSEEQSRSTISVSMIQR